MSRMARIVVASVTLLLLALVSIHQTVREAALGYRVGRALKALDVAREEHRDLELRLHARPLPAEEAVVVRPDAPPGGEVAHAPRP